MSESDPRSRPVFIHSLWRCASTYFMEKFMAGAGVMAFTEPFNEHLRLIDTKMLDEEDRQQRESLNHPNQGQSYYGTYRDLIVPGDMESPGVRDFDIRFPLNFWFADKDRGQSRYLESLLDYARGQGNLQPVLGFVRSLGRVGLLRRLGGVHLVLVREPFDVYWSGFTQARDKANPYFAVQYAMIAALCREVPVLDELARRYDLPKLKIKGPFYTYGRACNRFREDYAGATELLREAFCLVALMSYGAAFPSADLVVSVDRLSRDEAYRVRVSGELARLTGHELDFADCRCPCYDEPAERAAFEAAWLDAQARLERARDPRWLAGGRLLESFRA